MTAQQLFYDCLSAQKATSPYGPSRMPAVCVAGYHDFDRLKAELLEDKHYLTLLESTNQLFDPDAEQVCKNFFNRKSGPPFGETVLKDPESEKCANVSDIDDPELDALQLVPKNEVCNPEKVPALDELQLKSQMDYFEFCGAVVYRALAMQTGFVFA